MKNNCKDCLRFQLEIQKLKNQIKSFDKKLQTEKRKWFNEGFEMGDMSGENN